MTASIWCNKRTMGAVPPESGHEGGGPMPLRKARLGTQAGRSRNLRPTPRAFGPTAEHLGCSAVSADTALQCACKPAMTA
jgi:hypothetical protein